VRGISIAVDKIAKARISWAWPADVRLAKAKMRFYTTSMTKRAILYVAAGRLRPDPARARMRGPQARISIGRVG